MTATLEPATEPRAGAPRLHRDVVPGVHRLEHAYTNCYIVTDGPDWTLVDAALVKGVEATTELPGSGTVDVPGRPEVVYTPGHTFGHVGLHLRDRDALICGDALVTLDPYKGIPGAQIVAGAATADSRRALASLDAIAATGARVLLPGHGEPWRDGAEAAVAAARATGPS